MKEQPPVLDISPEELTSLLKISRRDLVVRGINMSLAMLTIGDLTGCKTVQKDDRAQVASESSERSFLKDIERVEAATPIPDLKPTDPKYQVATRTRAGGIAKVIGLWLATSPYQMLAELHAQPEATMPIFKRDFGPVIIFRKASVIKALEATDTLTVDLYTGEIKRGTDGNFDPAKYSHFILGTDNDALYRPDSILLRKVVNRNDKTLLTELSRKACEGQIKKNQANGQMDLVQELSRPIPIAIVESYLGVPAVEKGEKIFDGQYEGGQEFDLPKELKETFSFQFINRALAPTSEHVYTWVRDAFHNTFNNFAGSPERFTEVREAGIRAVEYLSAWTFVCLKYYKKQIADGKTVPDTMLTRLLKLQSEMQKGEAADLLAEMKVSREEALKRLDDSMIRSNVLSTVFGAVANPEEGNARILNVYLDFKEDDDKAKGKIPDDGKRHFQVLNGSSHDKLLQACQGSDQASYETLRRFAIEFLRLQPQGEVLVRACVKDTDMFGTTLKRGRTVFVSQAGAMHDPKENRDVFAVDITRDEELNGFEKNSDRPNEDPQSKTYLHHGYGRHKCLGRYASEISMTEVLRSVVLLGDVKRASTLEVDEDGLYVTRLLATFPAKNS